MIVRLAEIRDIADLASAAQSFVATAYPDKIDPEHLIATAETAVSDPNGIVAILDGEHFAGCYVGGLVNSHISGERMLVEIFLWVDPEFRGNGHKLVEFAEDVARDRGATSCWLSHPAIAERAGQTFERWGYALAEKHYRKAL